MKKVILPIVTSVCFLASFASTNTGPMPFEKNEHGNSSYTSWSATQPASTYSSHILLSEDDNAAGSARALTEATMLGAGSCGASGLSLADHIYANPVRGAEAYEYMFINLELGFHETVIHDRSLNSLLLRNVPGLKYGETYTVQVRFKMRGEWSEFGDPCTISLREFPVTSLGDGSCGARNLTISDIIYSNPVPGATNYEYIFSNNELGYSEKVQRGSAHHSLPLSMTQGLVYGHTYNVRVRAEAGGEWGEFGRTCHITLDDFPTTMIGSQCGATDMSLDDFLYTEPIDGAEEYQFHFFNTEIGYTHYEETGSHHNSIKLSNVDGLAYGLTYLVRVRAKVGGEWGIFGSSCQITLMSHPVSQVSESQCGESGFNSESIIYVDPVPGAEDYAFLVSNPAIPYSQTIVRGGHWNSLPLVLVEDLQENQTYFIHVRSKVNGIWSPFGPACSITTGSQERTPETLTEENTSSSLKNMSVFPNPTTGQFTLDLNTDSESLIQVYNSQGQLLIDENNSAKQVSFDLSGYAKGVYVVRVESQGQVQYQRLIISD